MRAPAAASAMSFCASHGSPWAPTCVTPSTVNHDRPLTQLREKTGGGKLLRLIGRYLRAGVELPDGTREARQPSGCPQGERSESK